MEKIRPQLQDLGFALPHNDWVNMHIVYTNWVHDVDCKLRKAFLAQGNQMRPALLEEMQEKLNEWINRQDADAKSAIENAGYDFYKDTLPQPYQALAEACDERKLDAYKFSKLVERHKPAMNEMLRAFEDFKQAVGLGGKQ